MGIYDRDYYREDSRWSNPFARAKGTVFLCLFYTVFYVAQIATLDPIQRPPVVKATGLTEFLQLDPDKLQQGELWRVISYALVHDPVNPFHVIVTVIFLAWIGHHVEDIYGLKEYLTYFIIASLLGGVAYGLASLAGLNVPVLRGPSGAVTAIMVLYALHYPTRTICFFFIPIPIWLFIGIYAFADVAGLAGGRGNPAVVAVHVVGASLAFLHHTYSLRVSNWLPSFNRPSPRRQAKPRLRVFSEQPQPEPAATALNAAAGNSPPPDNRTVDEHFEAKLDQVLEKVSLHGQESLTEAERDILKKASEFYKKRRQSN